MKNYKNLCIHETSTTGTGTLTLGASPNLGVSGQPARSLASGDNGKTFNYYLENGSDGWESGTGVYTHSGTTFTRVLGSSSTGSLLSLTAATKVYIGNVAEGDLAYLLQLWKEGASGHLVPDANNTRDFGTPSYKVRSIYVGTNVTIDGTLTVGGTNVITYIASIALVASTNASDIADLQAAVVTTTVEIDQTDSPYAASAGERVNCSITSDTTVTLPASPSDGDKVLVRLQSTSSAATVTISPGLESIAGRDTLYVGDTTKSLHDEIEFTYDGTRWVTEERLHAHFDRMTLSADLTTNSAATPTVISHDQSDADQVGNCRSGNKFIVKRAGFYSIKATSSPRNNLSDQQYYESYIYVNGSRAGLIGTITSSGTTNSLGATAFYDGWLNEGDEVQHYFMCQQSNKGAWSGSAGYTALTVREELGSGGAGGTSTYHPEITGLLVHSNASDSDHDIDITNGGVWSEDGLTWIENTSGTITRAIDNASHRSGSLTADTEYYIIAGYDSGGSFDVKISTTNALPSGWQTYKAIDIRRTDSSSNLKSMEMTEGDGLRRVNVYRSPSFFDYGTATIASTPTLYAIDVPHIAGIEAMVMGYFAGSAIINLNHGTLASPPTRGGKEHRGNNTDQNRFNEVLAVNASGQIYANYTSVSGSIAFTAMGYSAWRALN